MLRINCSSQVIEDLKDECSKFGQVTAVAVPRPPNPAESAAVFGTGNFGKVRTPVPLPAAARLRPVLLVCAVTRLYGYQPALPDMSCGQVLFALRCGRCTSSPPDHHIRSRPLTNCILKSLLAVTQAHAQG